MIGGLNLVINAGTTQERHLRDQNPTAGSVAIDCKEITAKEH
jgi:hypothetical protein